jgi:hypothetical protein
VVKAGSHRCSLTPGAFFAFKTRDEVRAYCRHHFIPNEQAKRVDLPLWLTKRGVIVRATKR